MKRIVSLLLTVAMLATMCSFTTFAAGWSLPTGAQDDNTVRFALIADSHLQVADGKSTSSQTAKFEQALAAYEGLGVDALLMAGDIIMLAATDTTKDLMTPEYNVLKTSLEKYNYSTKANTTAVDTGKIPVIYATGNHEYPVGAGTGDASTTALATFKEQMACEQNSHTVIEGIHFITSGGDTYSSYAFDNEEWIMQEVTKAVTATPDAPVFLTLHHPVWGTVKGSDSGDKRYSQNFRDFLNANKNVIVLSAHTHAALCEPVGIWQDGFTAVTAGYVGGSNEQWSEGMLVEVNGSVATFYKMDLLNGKYIDSPWVVDINDLSTYSVAGRANTNAPQFASGAKITVTGIESDQAKL